MGRGIAEGARLDCFQSFAPRREPADEPGDLPACVTGIPIAIVDSLTANNLRDLRLVACLPRSWPSSPGPSRP